MNDQKTVCLSAIQHSSFPEVPFPEKFRFALRLGGPTGQHKERIAETIEKFHNSRVRRFFPCQPDADALGPPTHSPRLMQQAGDFSSARQDELLEGRQILLAAVDHLLQAG